MTIFPTTGHRCRYTTLTLDSALKQVTRYRLVFNCCFKNTYISLDSVATHLRCGGIFSDSVTTNFRLMLRVKKNLKIGSYLTKLLEYKNFVPFSGPPCTYIYLTLDWLQSKVFLVLFCSRLCTLLVVEVQWAFFYIFIKIRCVFDSFTCKWWMISELRHCGRYPPKTIISTKK